MSDFRARRGIFILPDRGFRQGRRILWAGIRSASAKKDRLLSLRLNDEIDAEVFARKHQPLPDREAEVKLRIETADSSRHEIAELAVKVL